MRNEGRKRWLLNSYYAAQDRNTSPDDIIYQRVIILRYSRTMLPSCCVEAFVAEFSQKHMVIFKMVMNGMLLHMA